MSRLSVRGEGQWLYEANGREVLDAYNNVAHVGHCHPYVVEALYRQAKTLTLIPAIIQIDPNYAERLVASSPNGLNSCVFTCTGSEANDVAWRLPHHSQATLALLQPGIPITEIQPFSKQSMVHRQSLNVTHRHGGEPCLRHVF